MKREANTIVNRLWLPSDYRLAPVPNRANIATMQLLVGDYSRKISLMHSIRGPAAVNARPRLAPRRARKFRQLRRNASRHDGWMRTALKRRRAGHDPRYAGDLCGDDRHVCGGNHRITSAGYVAANRIDRDVSVSEHDARQWFDFDIEDAIALFLREVSHLRLRKFYVLEIALRDLGNRFLDLRACQLKVAWRPIVKLFRKPADCCSLRSSTCFRMSSTVREPWHRLA